MRDIKNGTTLSKKFIVEICIAKKLLFDALAAIFSIGDALFFDSAAASGGGVSILTCPLRGRPE
jgi:hypothetical protein